MDVNWAKESTTCLLGDLVESWDHSTKVGRGKRREHDFAIFAMLVAGGGKNPLAHR